jgi:Uma2 family endonuclease
MASALVQPKLTVDDYLEWESQQTEKHDFFRGEVFAMTGGTLRHNRATLASAIAFKNHLKGQACQVFAGDVKVVVNVAEHLFYPDVVVTCNAQDLSDLDAVKISAPLLVLEVLSPSTAAYDRGQKFLSLQKLPSLQEYALLDAHAPRLEVHRRNAAGRFELYVFEGADCEAELASIDWRGPVSSLLD